ncbi:hypothetical protein C9374_009121 [Naegleria lovaniensis]|uniref:Uncharacterized protein n=1 Tax=Naegleria lovaniensis TaxID=51637 RepID=A0AA88KF95_NAELO|nr:uncharacterized protein C9374_009121 [Naegleria lovaniensis]KAG2377605.1 hypothetical protein C9374_009121 [Naegleria lovaniensis]
MFFQSRYNNNNYEEDSEDELDVGGGSSALIGNPYDSLIEEEEEALNQVQQPSDSQKRQSLLNNSHHSTGSTIEKSKDDTTTLALSKLNSSTNNNSKPNNNTNTSVRASPHHSSLFSKHHSEGYLEMTSSNKENQKENYKFEDRKVFERDPFEVHSTRSDRSNKNPLPFGGHSNLTRHDSDDELLDFQKNQGEIERPRSARPSSAGTRPSSAGSMKSKPQYKLSSIPHPKNFPIASSRSTNSVLDKNGLSKKQVVQNYLSNVNKHMKKRTIPSNFYKDPEGMYMDLQELRQEIAILRKDNQNLKTLAQKSEADSIRKQKQVEELLRAHALVETKGTRYENLFKEVNLVKSLKSRIRELEKALGEKETEFQRIKLDSRYTRVRELETELKAYYTESRRLQKVVEDLEQERSAMQDLEDENDKMNKQNLKLRELIVKMKQVQDYYKEQNVHLSEENRHLHDNNGISSELSMREHQIEELTTKLKELQQKLDDSYQTNSELKVSNSELQRISDEIQFQSNITKKENSELKNKLEELRTNFESQLEDQKRQVELLKREKENMCKENELQTQSSQILRSSVASFEHQVADKEREIQFLKAQLKEKHDLVDSRNLEILNLRNQCEEKDSEISQLQTKMKELRKANKVLLDEISVLKDQQAQQHNVSAVMTPVPYPYPPIVLPSNDNTISSYPPPIGIPNGTQEITTPQQQSQLTSSYGEIEENFDVGGNYSFDDEQQQTEQDNLSIYDHAATQMQLLARGFIARRQFKELKEQAMQKTKEPPVKTTEVKTENSSPVTDQVKSENPQSSDGSQKQQTNTKEEVNSHNTLAANPSNNLSTQNSTVVEETFEEPQHSSYDEFGGSMDEHFDSSYVQEEPINFDDDYDDRGFMEDDFGLDTSQQHSYEDW